MLKNVKYELLRDPFPAARQSGVVEMNEPGPTAADHPAHCDHSYVERSERCQETPTKSHEEKSPYPRVVSLLSHLQL